MNLLEMQTWVVWVIFEKAYTHFLPADEHVLARLQMPSEISLLSETSQLLRIQLNSSASTMFVKRFIGKLS